VPVVSVPQKTTGFEPLKESLFRDRWIASIISNVGGWMQDTAGTWLMAVLTTSPLLISLMQTAASLPVLLLGLLAGATADIYDRRQLLIFWQAWMLVSVAIMSVLVFFGVISPWVLLALTFALNIGAAMNNPAWQAIVPELVPASQVPDAVALNSAGYNLARGRPRAWRPGGGSVRAPGNNRGGVGISTQCLIVRGGHLCFVSLASHGLLQKRASR
jgi:MFS family permease